MDFRKKRKEDKKNRAMGIESKISNKNMKVPNLANFKKNMVQDLEKKKQTSSRQELINSLKEKLEQSNNIACDNIYAYKIDADSKAMLYDNDNDRNIIEEEDEKRLNRENKDFSRRAYMKDLKEVIENSDVVLEVLDSRDPLSCKSQELEELIRSQKDEKKIILILNKIDLIPM
jgi:nuclear GTP-binding protein